MQRDERGYLVLEDGRVFEGVPFGARREARGEVVFHTGLTGYQEILTDPSYCGQIVTLTYPHIGNYGINREDEESDRIRVEALIVKDLSPVASSHRSEGTLSDYLAREGIPGLTGIDTRALTRHIRTRGAMRGSWDALDMMRGSTAVAARGREPGGADRDPSRPMTGET